jgi:hypothetical protein
MQCVEINEIYMKTKVNEINLTSLECGQIFSS